MSPRLNLVDVNDKPKSAARVNAKCIKCGTIQNIVLSELVRTVNRQSRHVDTYHCAKCFRTVDSYRLEAKETSKAALAGRTEELSARAKEALARPEVRAKILEHTKKLSVNEEFKKKVSVAIKNKFDTDEEYVRKVQLARSNYHSDKKNPQLWDLSKFVEVASRVHENKYSYSNTVYDSFKTKVEVTCSKHGNFWVRPSHHIHYKNGCPQCNAEKTRSDGEQKLCDFVESIWQGEVIKSDRSILNGMEIDIWIPGANLGIEYNGAWYHSTNNTASKNYHSIKSTVAHKNGINLMQFVDLDLQSKRPIAESMIRNKLGLNSKVFARNCDISSVNKRDCIEFFNANHYHGWAYYDLAYGLYHNNTLKSVLSLRVKDGIAEIARFATLSGYNVVGGFSKLMKHFIRNNDITEVFTYVDRSFTTSESCYSKFGMVLETTTKPGYRYLKNNKLLHRMKFQKHKLAGILENFDPSKTEVDNMLANGYRLLYDAGNLKYRLKLK